MPLNGSGVFSRLYNFVTDRNNGVKIVASRMDAEFDGISTALSSAIYKDGQQTWTANQSMGGYRLTNVGNASADADALNRVTADGRYVRTGSDGAAALQAILDEAVHTTTDVASAATSDIGAAATDRVRITGTTTITSFGTGANRLRFVHFADALTLTHNATSLILPGGANITTAAGDAAIFSSDNSGYWRCLVYQRADGSLISPATATEAAGGTNSTKAITSARLHEARVDVASATTTDIGAAASNFVRITGTTTITGLGTAAAGVWRDVTFQGALTLTHNGTSLLIPGGANVTTAANDRMRCRSLGSGNWIVLDYTRTNGVPVAGTLTLGTSVASTSGTAIDFTGLLAGVKRITLNLSGVSSNASASYIVQIGDSGGVETSGYLGTGTSMSTSGASNNYTTGFGIGSNTLGAGVLFHGSIVLTLLDSSTNLWSCAAVTARSDTAQMEIGAGSKSLSAVLDRIRLTTVAGTATFDAGTVNIIYEV